MNYGFPLKSKNLNLYSRINLKKSKPISSFIDFKNKNDTFKTIFSNKEVLLSLNRRNEYNTYNNIIKNSTILNSIAKEKGRNKTMKNIFKCKSLNDILGKTNKNENNNKLNKNNFLYLTSLYKLPVIKSKNILTKKASSPNFSKSLNYNYLSPSNNTSSINSLKSFNDSISSSNNESINNFFNLRYNNEINKSISELNQSNNSRNKSKRKPFSNLSASLKDKYYIDIERKYNHKLDAKLFPSDHSIKDKIIHMKKVSIFWNSVFKYCVPIINGQKYKLQHIISSENKLNNINSNLKQSYSNYYDIFVKDDNKSIIKNYKSNSQSKIFI